MLTGGIMIVLPSCIPQVTALEGKNRRTRSYLDDLQTANCFLIVASQRIRYTTLFTPAQCIYSMCLRRIRVLVMHKRGLHQPVFVLHTHFFYLTNRRTMNRSTVKPKPVILKHLSDPYLSLLVSQYQQMKCSQVFF